MSSPKNIISVRSRRLASLARGISLSVTAVASAARPTTVSARRSRFVYRLPRSLNVIAGLAMRQTPPLREEDQPHRRRYVHATVAPNKRKKCHFARHFILLVQSDSLEEPFYFKSADFFSLPLFSSSAPRASTRESVIAQLSIVFSNFFDLNSLINDFLFIFVCSFYAMACNHFKCLSISALDSIIIHILIFFLFGCVFFMSLVYPVIREHYLAIL